MRDDRKWTLDPFSNKTGYYERSLKVIGVKYEIQVLKIFREEYYFSLCPLAQFFTGTNRFYLGTSKRCKNFTR